MGFINQTDKYAAIPREMKQLPNWICWKAVPDEKAHNGIKKIPINPRTGEAASSTGADTWADYQTALKASARFSGIAFVFTNSPYFGVDLDDMPEDIADYTEGGADNRIAEFVHELQSYAEYSQSGKGIHIICRGTLPPGRRKAKQYEMYETGRYFIMSGKPCSSYTEIKDCTESIKPLHAKYLGGGRRVAADNTRPCGRGNTHPNFLDNAAVKPAPYSVSGAGFNEEIRQTTVANWERALPAAGSDVPYRQTTVAYKKRTQSAAPRNQPSCTMMSVNEIVEKAKAAKNGEKFGRLYSGDISDYGSQSEADLAFCNMLAFWTCCDIDKMDAIFRQSGLMRDKWDKVHGRDTYGNITIGKAIAECSTTYDPKKSESPSGDGQYAHVDFLQGTSEPASKTVLGAGVTAVSSRQFGCVSSAETRRPAPKAYYSLDDMGNALRFVDLFGDNIRYNYNDKKWLYYNKLKWCVDNDGTVERLVDIAVESMKAEMKHYTENEGADGEITKAFRKHMKSSRSNKGRDSLMKVARHHVPVLPMQLDRYKMALNTPSGVLNLKNGELSESKPEYYFTKITAVEYSKEAECPRWLQFLDEIFDGDRELIRYIQKAVGYTLSGSTAEQCVFFLYGTGRNGKSTFLDVIREVFGDYASNIQPETIMVKNNSASAINSDIARLKGARLVTSVEPNEGVKINEGLIKQLTGDDMVTARKLYSEEFEFKPEFKLWMATNYKPIIRGTDTGIWRRIHMIPFTVAIPSEKVDKNLKYKLRAEMTGIFRWCIDGCLMWQNEGLKMPKAVLDSVREYRREMDVISAFIEDKCELSGSVQSSVLYACYAQWAQDNNEYCMSATKFSMEISKRFEKVKTRAGKYYNGISIFNEV